MTWMNVQFPPRLAFGVECDPEWAGTVIATIGGQETRTLPWADARHNYDASFAIRSAADHIEIREHFHMARGQLHSWPLLDPLDNSVTVSDGVVAATATTNVYQLEKRYGSGDFEYDRKITRPFVTKVYLSGVLKTPGSDYTLDADTGLLTMTGASAANITWSGSFYVPCRYDTKKLPVRITNKNQIDGFLVSSDSIPIVEVKE